MTSRVDKQAQSFYRVVTSFSGTENPNSAIVNYSNSFNGADDPRWRSKVKSVRNATNGYAVSRRRVYAPITVASTYYIPSKRVLVHYGNFFYNIGTSPNYRFPQHDQVMLDKVRAIAEAKFIARADEALTSFQGGAFLGELGSTLRGLRHPLAALRRDMPKAYQDIRKHFYPKGSPHSPSAARQWMRGGKQTNASKAYGRAARAAAGTWLEYAFGWMPLFHDIGDAVNALSRPQLVTQNVTSGIVHLRGPEASQAEYLSQGAPIQFRGNTRTRNEYYARVKGVVGFSTSASGRRAMDFGLTANHFLPTIWEVLPWSWLVDYFTNVGDIVNAVSFNRASVRWVSNSAWYEGTREIFMRGESTNVNYSLLSSGPYKNTWYNFRLSRTSILDFAPELAFDHDLGIRQGVNAISALIQRLR